MVQLAHREMIKLEIALEEACRSIPHGGDHQLRKQVAQKLLESALNGNTKLGELTEIARTALTDATGELPRADTPSLARR